MSLLVLAPIKADAPGDETHVEALRTLFATPAWETMQREFFARLSTLHMARFQIIDQLIPAMGDRTAPDELLYKHLLFVAEIDGTEGEFYDAMYCQDAHPQQICSPEGADAGTFVRSIWGHSAGYPEPGKDAIYLFRRFMRRYRFTSQLPYQPFDATRDEILRALLLKEETQKWMPNPERLATASPDELRDDAKKFLDRRSRLAAHGARELENSYHGTFEELEGEDVTSLSGSSKVAED